MYTLGHIGGALIVYSPVAAVLSVVGEPQLGAVGLSVAVLCSMLPDIDERLPVSHRGPTHTIWFAGAVTVAVFTAAVVFTEVAVAAFLAATALLSVLSHLVGDSITPMGIAPFRPLSAWHHSFDVVPSKNSRANLRLFSLGVLFAGTSQLPVVV